MHVLYIHVYICACIQVYVCIYIILYAFVCIYSLPSSLSLIDPFLPPLSLSPLLYLAIPLLYVSPSPLTFSSLSSLFHLLLSPSSRFRSLLSHFLSLSPLYFT